MRLSVLRWFRGVEGRDGKVEEGSASGGGKGRVGKETGFVRCVHFVGG